MKVTSRLIVVTVVVGLYIPLAIIVVWWVILPKRPPNKDTAELIRDLAAKGIAVGADINRVERLVTNGAELICEPTVVGFVPPIGDEDGYELSAKRCIAAIAHFTRVRQILLSKQSIGTELTVLVNLPDLQFLSLRNCEVAVDSWAFLGQLRALENLLITSSNLSDNDLRTMELPSSLVTLELSYNAHVTEDGMRSLSQKSSIAELAVACTGVSELEFAEGMTGLETLDLMGTRIGDEDLESLTALPNLHTLNIEYTEVTNEAVNSLVQMRALRRLEVRYTELSRRGIDELKDRRPNLEIGWQ